MVQATIVKLLGNNGDRISFKCANASAIAVGDFLELADPMTVTAHAGNVDTPIVGICCREKVANDGEVWVAGITNCLFKATILAGGSCTIGDTVSMGNATGEVNLSSSLDKERGWAVGHAYETGAAAETALFRSCFQQ